MNRRSLLQTAGYGLAAFRLPRVWLSAQGASPGAVMTALSSYMAAARPRAPAGGRRAGEAPHRRYLRRDDFRVRAAARAGGASIRAGPSGQGTATVAGSSLVAAPIDAALANGVLAHADETDDSHSASQSHPGCAVVPAALAAGEEHGIDGTRFLRAVTLGYDVGTRVTMAMGGVEFRNQSHRSTHSIAGDVRRGGGRRVRAPARRAADAVGARLHRAAVIGHRRLAA